MNIFQKSILGESCSGACFAHEITKLYDPLDEVVVMHCKESRAAFFRSTKVKF